MKIGFYLKNTGFANTNIENILEGNPGIGGSEYEILSISYLLSKRNNEIEVILFVDKEGYFPDLNYIVVNNLKNCLLQCEMSNIKFLILDYKSHDKLLMQQHANNIKYIIWAHNFIKFKDLKFFASNDSIVRLIHVSKESYDLYRDYKSIYKSVYINNGVKVHKLEHYFNENSVLKKEDFSVVYLGSIIPTKGFHVLAKVWKEIIKQVPDAKLYVIGSGRLYDKNLKLGTYGIAESKYETKFIKYILDDNSNILPSIYFLGTLGIEKNNILKKCKVGVPNPSGLTETFGISAVEMQLMGCQIATINCPGFISTVYDSTGLYSKPSHLARTIIKLLKTDIDKKKYLDTYSYIEKNFSFENVINEWESEVVRWHMLPVTNLVIENNFHSKRLKENLRKLKLKNSICSFLPPVEFYWNLKAKFRI